MGDSYTPTAITQWFAALVFLTMCFVAVRIGRWTLAALGMFLGTFFLRVGFINWGRDHGSIDIIGWASQPNVILLHSAMIAILGVGIVGEIVLREWGRHKPWDAADAATYQRIPEHTVPEDVGALSPEFRTTDKAEDDG